MKKTTLITSLFLLLSSHVMAQSFNLAGVTLTSGQAIKLTQIKTIQLADSPYQIIDKIQLTNNQIIYGHEVDAALLKAQNGITLPIDNYNVNGTLDFTTLNLNNWRAQLNPEPRFKAIQDRFKVPNSSLGTATLPNYDLGNQGAGFFLKN